MKNIFLTILVLLNFCAQGQELTFGDSSIVEQIKAKTSWIYENKEETHFFLTKESFYPIKTYGTSIIAHSRKDSINRIISVSLTKKGPLSTEWYFSENKLIYVYQSFEYFNEVKTENNWKNFKGLRAWESRYYFIDEIKYHKHKGQKEIKESFNSKQLLKTADKILNYIRS